MELPLETVQNQLPLQEILQKNDHLTNQLTTTFLNWTTDSLSDFAKNHPSFLEGHYADASKTYHIKTTDNHNLEEHCSNAEISSRNITSNVVHGSYSFSESGDHYTVCLGGKCFDMMPTNPNKSTVFEFSDNYYKAFRNGVELTHESVISEDISECLVSSNYGT